MSKNKDLKIAIVAHSLRVAGGLSVGQNFLRSLNAVAPQHQYLVTVPAGLGYEHIELPEGSKYEVYRAGASPVSRVFYDRCVLPEKIKEFGADVVFCMANAGMQNLNCKQAVLVQDSHMLYDEKHYAKERWIGKAKWRYQKHRMRKCLKHIDLVFCQTPVTGKRFSKVFNFPFEKIRLMPNAVSESIDNNLIERRDVPDVFQGKKYFNLFYLAKFYAHKNFEILIDLFKTHSDKLWDVRCVITVSPQQHKNAAKFLQEVAKYGLQDRIINVGPLKQEQLAPYFLHADALFFPTLLESFSGTYLEAMHFGLPILTSDLDFARYICDDAALYFDPWSVDAAAEEILKLKSNPQLCAELADKGRKRASIFIKSWKDITAEVIRDLKAVVKVS